jgi:hypothetical protein
MLSKEELKRRVERSLLIEAGGNVSSSFLVALRKVVSIRSAKIAAS